MLDCWIKRQEVLVLFPTLSLVWEIRYSKRNSDLLSQVIWGLYGHEIQQRARYDFALNFSLQKENISFVCFMPCHLSFIPEVNYVPDSNFVMLL